MTRDATLCLDGAWRFSPDGRTWGSILVPGCWEAQGYPATLEGPVVYERAFSLPPAWPFARATLRFGAASFLARVWLNGVYLGRHDGAWDAFEFDATPWLRLEGENHLRVEVVKPGRRFPWEDTLAGFIPEVAMPFGGLWQSVQLRGHGDLTLSRPYVRTRLSGVLRASLAVRNPTSRPRQAEVRAQVVDPAGRVVAERSACVVAPPGRAPLSLDLRLAEPVPWSPDEPRLYRLRLELVDEAGLSDATERAFGVREVRAAGRQLQLNRHPILLRGALHWGFYPETIAPIPSEAQIRAELARLRALGFNLVKHCLWVPPERYQDLADEAGMLLWQELPLWPPTVSAAQRRRALHQLPAIVAQRRGHPSLAIYTLGCELNASADAPFLRRLYRAVRRLDPQALVRDNSGSGECYGGLLEDFADFSDYHFYAEPAQLGPLLDAFAADWRRARPWLFGEFCDSDTFRHASTLRQRLAPAQSWWLSADVARNPLASTRELPILDQERRLAEAGLPWQAAELGRLSLARSLAVRKQVLERARRASALAGYVITSLRDVPIVPSGLFDDLGREKWPPEQFAPLNADTVLLLVPPLQRTWTAGGDRLRQGEAYAAWAGEQVWRSIVVSHFGRGELRAALRWRLEDGRGASLAEGGPLPVRLPAGVVREVAVLSFQAPPAVAPTRCTLRVWLEGGGPAVHNHWPLWLLPRLPGHPRPSVQLHDGRGSLEYLWAWLAAIPVQPTPPSSSAPEAPALPPPGRPGDRSPVVLASVLDQPLLDHVRRGGRALVVFTSAAGLPARRVPFWREGLPLLYPHPALAAFPHDGYADLAWDGLAPDLAVDVAQLQAALGAPAEYRPLVRRLDCRDFSVADYLAEARVGAGRLLVTSLAFERAASPEWGLERCPVAATLLEELLRYLSA